MKTQFVWSSIMKVEYVLWDALVDIHMVGLGGLGGKEQIMGEFDKSFLNYLNFF